MESTATSGMDTVHNYVFTVKEDFTVNSRVSFSALTWRVRGSVEEEWLNQVT